MNLEVCKAVNFTFHGLYILRELNLKNNKKNPN